MREADGSRKCAFEVERYPSGDREWPEVWSVGSRLQWPST